MKKTLGALALFTLASSCFAELGLPTKTIVVSDFARKRQDLLDTLRVNLPGAKVGIRRFRGAEVVLRVDYPLDRPPANPENAKAKLHAHADRLIREAYPGFELAPDSVFRFVPRKKKGLSVRPPAASKAIRKAQAPKISQESPASGLDAESSARLGRLLESWRKKKQTRGLNPKLFSKAKAASLGSLQDELALLQGSESRLGLSSETPSSPSPPKTASARPPKAIQPPRNVAPILPKKVAPGISASTMAAIRDYRATQRERASTTSTVKDIYKDIFRSFEADQALAEAQAAEREVPASPPSPKPETKRQSLPPPQEDPLFQSRPTDQSLSAALEQGLPSSQGL